MRSAAVTTEATSNAREYVLLLVLATLWGASYTFIRLGVTTIPPVTLIAERTLIGGALHSRAARRGDMAAVHVPSAAQQRGPVHVDRLGGKDRRGGSRHDPVLDFADLHLSHHLRDYPPRAGDIHQAVRCRYRNCRHQLDRRR